MKTCPDDPYAAALLENYNLARKKQIIQRTTLLERVNSGLGTPDEIEKVRRKRTRDRLYNYRRRDPGTQLPNKARLAGPSNQNK